MAPPPSYRDDGGLGTIDSVDMQQQTQHQSNGVTSPRISVVTDSTPIVTNLALSAKKRFRSRGGEGREESGDPTYPSEVNTDSYNSYKNVARAVGFLSAESDASDERLDLCPVCSLPLLYQDLEASKGESDNKRIALCQSSTSSTTTTTTRTNADSRTVGSQSLDNFTLHDFDTRPPPGNRMGGATCGMLLPMQSILEQFVGSYCDYVSGPKPVGSGPRIDRLMNEAADELRNGFSFGDDGSIVDGDSVKHIPPYCANCEAYIVPEAGDDEQHIHDEMLTNLASWLAVNNSSDDEGTGEASVAFRPSRGSIKVILGQKSTSSRGSHSTSSRSRRQVPPKIPAINMHGYNSSDGNGSQWESHPRRTNSSPRRGMSPRRPTDLQDRHSIEEDCPPEKASNRPYARSQSPRRRRKYLNLLDEDDPVKVRAEVFLTPLEPVVPDPPPLIRKPDPRPRMPSRPSPKPTIQAPRDEDRKEVVFPEDPPASAQEIFLEMVTTVTSDDDVLEMVTTVACTDDDVLEMVPTVASKDDQEVVLEMEITDEEREGSYAVSTPSPLEKSLPLPKQSVPATPPMKAQPVFPPFKTSDSTPPLEQVRPTSPPKNSRPSSPIKQRKNPSPTKKRQTPSPPEERQPPPPPGKQEANASASLSIVVPSPPSATGINSMEQQPIHPSIGDDDASIGTCNTLKEETIIIGDYDEKRNIATKAIGRRLMEGFVLTQTQCSHCQMPMMERDGLGECVVCPLVSRKAKKRANLKRMGQTIMDTFDSESPPKKVHDNLKLQSMSMRAKEPLKVPLSPRREQTSSDDPSPLQHMEAPLNRLQEQLHDVNQHQATDRHKPTEQGQSRDTNDYHTVDEISRKHLTKHLMDVSEFQITDRAPGKCFKERSDEGNTECGQQPVLQLEAREPEDNWNEAEEDQDDVRGILINWKDEDEDAIAEMEIDENFPMPQDDDEREQAHADHILPVLHISTEGADFDNELVEGTEDVYDMYDMEIGSQEVYHRLLNGWLLTNSNCPDCLAPIMQSVNGEMECVLCNQEEAENISPIRGTQFYETTSNWKDKKSGNDCYESSQYDSPAYSPEKHIKPTDMRNETDESSIGQISASGLRYLAIPEGLDLNNPDAVLAFLTKQKQLSEPAAGATDQNATQSSNRDRDGDGRYHSPIRGRHRESQEIGYRSNKEPSEDRPPVDIDHDVMDSSSGEHTISRMEHAPIRETSREINEENPTIVQKERWALPLQDQIDTHPSVDNRSYAGRYKSPIHEMLGEGHGTSKHSPIVRGVEPRDAPDSNHDNRPDPAGAAMVDAASTSSSSTMHTPIQLISSASIGSKSRRPNPSCGSSFVSRVPSGSDSVKSKPIIQSYDSRVSERTVDSEPKPLVHLDDSQLPGERITSRSRSFTHSSDSQLPEQSDDSKTKSFNQSYAPRPSERNDDVQSKISARSYDSRPLDKNNGFKSKLATRSYGPRSPEESDGSKPKSFFRSYNSQPPRESDVSKTKPFNQSHDMHDDGQSKLSINSYDARPLDAGNDSKSKLASCSNDPRPLEEIDGSKSKSLFRSYDLQPTNEGESSKRKQFHHAYDPRNLERNVDTPSKLPIRSYDSQLPEEINDFKSSTHVYGPRRSEDSDRSTSKPVLLSHDPQLSEDRYSSKSKPPPFSSDSSPSERNYDTKPKLSAHSSGLNFVPHQPGGLKAVPRERAASAARSLDRTTWKPIQRIAGESASKSLSYHAFEGRSQNSRDFNPPVPLEIVPKSRSKRSEEMRALFEAAEDDSKLILKFDSSVPFPTDEFGNSESRSPSPRRAMLQSARDDASLSKPQSPPDFVLHHTISPRNTSVSFCHMCKNAHRRDVSSTDVVCGNPRCTVYMIPKESINIFSSTMNEKLSESKDFGSLGAGQTWTTRSTTVGSQSREHSYDRWQVQDVPSMESSLGSDKYRFNDYSDKRDPRSLSQFTDEPTSFDRISSVDSINSEQLQTLLSRMGDARNKLKSSESSSDKGVNDDRTDMAKLIDRLASAAVAIKDLEQSVYEAEDSSPQRSMSGRPPTSPTSRAAYRGNDRDVHWF